MKALSFVISILSAVAATSARSQMCGDNVTYLSSSIDVYAYLENEQRELYESNPRLVDDPYLREQLDDPYAVETWNDIIKRLIEQGIIDDPDELPTMITCESLPTRYESPLTYGLIKLTMDKLSSALRWYYPNIEEIYFGTLPTSTIEARALIPLGFSDPIIILNRDVFHFTGKFSKAVSAAIPITVVGDQVVLSYDEAPIRQHLMENPWIVEDFAQAMFYMVTSGSPARANENSLDANHNLFHARLVSGLDAFVVGHEVGHIALGHAGERRIFPLSPPDILSNAADSVQSMSLTLADYGENQELAADEAGLRLFVGASTVDESDFALGVAIGAAGSDLFFAIIDLTDKYRNVLHLPPMHNEAHPPAAIRSQNLDRLFESEEMRSLGLLDMPDFRLVTRTAFRVLAEESEPAIMRAINDYQKGQR